eukprot:s2013_g8.t1
MATEGMREQTESDVAEDLEICMECSAIALLATTLTQRLELQPRMDMARAEPAQPEVAERPRYGTLLLEDLHPAVVR